VVTHSAASRRTSGLFFGVTSSVFFSASGTFAKALTDAGFSPLQAVWLRILGACLILLVAMTLLRGPGAFSALLRDRSSLRGVVLFSTVISYVVGGMAVQRLSAPVAAGIAYVEPVSACVIAWVLLGQRLSAVQIAGGLVVLLGAYTAQRSAEPPTAVPVPAASVEHVSPAAE